MYIFIGLIFQGTLSGVDGFFFLFWLAEFTLCICRAGENIA